MTADKTIQNPNENLEIPQWINEEYFKILLEKDEPDYVKVLKFTPVAAIPPGENFTSIMLRVHIDLELEDGQTKLKQYIFKTMLDMEKGGKMIEEFGLFPKEVNMYKTYLPAYEALYKAAGKEVQLAPKCLHTEERDGSIHFVFEDLIIKDYSNVDRIKGFDMPHMRRVLQKLAEFHAASAVYVTQKGPMPAEYDEGLVSHKPVELHGAAYDVKANAFLKSMAQWGMEDTEKYIQDFPSFEQFVNMNNDTLVPDANGFNVLNHGDFWSSNVMCNYLPNGDIDHVLFLDFQLCKWGSPAVDLLFFITLSAANDIRLKEFDHFVEIYHEHLIECLNLLKYTKPLPKLRELQMDMYKQKNTFFAFFAVFNHLAPIQFPSDKDSNLHSLSEQSEAGDKLRMRLYSNPNFAKIMKDLYPFYCRRGIFRFKDFQ